MPFTPYSSSDRTREKLTKQIYSGYRIHLEASQLGIPAIPQTIKGACGDIVQSLKEGPVNFELDELNRLLVNNGSGGGAASISIALADIATESPTGTWTLDANYTLAVGATLTIASGITFIIPSGVTLTVNGTLQVSNSGTITTLGTLINNSNQTVQVDEFALFTIDGGTCINNGTFTNDGRLDVSNGGSLELAEGSIIENNGNVYVYGTNSNIQIAGDATFTNSGGLYTSSGGGIEGGSGITGTGTQGNQAPPVCEAQTYTSPLAQDETVEVCQSFTVEPEATFTIPTGITFTNNGIMTVCGELIVNGTFINNAYVNFDLSGAICKIYKDSDSSGNFINDGTCINNGSIYVYDDGTLENNGSLVNLSVIKYGNGSGSCGTGNFIGTYQGVPPTVGCPPVPPGPTTTSFAYTGAVQTYTAAGDGTITAYVYGAGGGGGGCPSSESGFVSALGGGGGYATGTFTVSQGQSLKIIVGGAGNGGTLNNVASSGAKSGGYGGGGPGGARADNDSYDGGGGGGYSGIYIGENIQSSHILIAGGGGGGGGRGDSYPTALGVGGSGGGSEGTGGFSGFGSIYNLSRGQQGAGGRGWATLPNTDGSGTALQGGSAQSTSLGDGGGGGGGGGYYGGGGGSSSRGGGGGSGYIGGTVTNGQVVAGNSNLSGGSNSEYYPTISGDIDFNIGEGTSVWSDYNRGGNGLVVLEFTPA
jgi:hypothetical protein